MNPIETLLHRRIGLDAATVGRTLIERTIRLRMKAHRLTTLEQYGALLGSSPAEWEELLEASAVQLNEPAKVTIPGPGLNLRD